MPAKESSTISIHQANQSGIKSVLMKYLKPRQNKKGEKVNKPSFEDFANTSFESKIREISEKCSELKSDTETVSKLEPRPESVFSFTSCGLY